MVSGGTDNHLMLVDLSATELTGKAAAETLERVGMAVNKNAIPFDTRSPFVTSGIRIGTPAITTRGMKEPEMEELGKLIVNALRDPENDSVLESTKSAVESLASRFPLP